MTKLRSRYPGLRPFDEQEGNNFFGRSAEIEALCRLLDLDKLIVLHGPSGMGKSSLINAGILPALSGVRHWEVPFHVITVRFTNYDPEFAKMRRKEKLKEGEEIEIVKDPVERFVEACENAEEPWPEVLPLHKESLWLRAKQVVIDQDFSPIRVVFILDQFEELFTYPEERVEEFARQLEDLYHQAMPEAIRRGLERKQQLDAELSEDQPPAPEKVQRLLETIEEPLDVKILISMRSDKLHFLDRLKPYLPEMMLNSFELRSFDVEQAKRAVLEPALLEGEGYISPRFTIPDSVLDHIIGFLEDKLTHRVDPAQLQIVCQHIEQQMIKRGKKLKKK